MEFRHHRGVLAHADGFAVGVVLQNVPRCGGCSTHTRARPSAVSLLLQRALLVHCLVCRRD
jgi:hypothetical protein